MNAYEMAVVAGWVLILCALFQWARKKVDSQ